MVAFKRSGRRDLSRHMQGTRAPKVSGLLTDVSGLDESGRANEYYREP